jgi:hypothetical protein
MYLDAMAGLSSPSAAGCALNELLMKDSLLCSTSMYMLSAGSPLKRRKK